MKVKGLTGKLVISFTVVALVLVIVGMVGFFSVRETTRSINQACYVQLPSVESLLIIKNNIASIENGLITLLMAHQDTAGIEQQYKEIRREILQCEAQSAIFSELDHDEVGAELWKNFSDAWEKLRQDTLNFVGLSEKVVANGVLNPNLLRKNIETIKGEYYFIIGQVGNMLQTELEIQGYDDISQSYFHRWSSTYTTSNSEIKEILSQIVPPMEQFYDAVKEIKEFIRQGDIDGASFTYEVKLMKSAAHISALFHKLNNQTLIAENLFKKMEAFFSETYAVSRTNIFQVLNNLNQINRRKTTEEAEIALSRSDSTQKITIAGIFIGFLFSLLFGTGISRSITRKINIMTDEMKSVSAEVVSASAQVSHASEAMAQNASNQAASIESSSAAMDEMAAMTRKNTDSADQANILVKDVKTMINSANESMSQMVGSMKEISTASEETFNIIKTIDEIAFQTNLLALNAAVEAARAGEAGAGFAVVADEVRNLAMRAAQAAKDTSKLIEGTVHKINDGATLVSITNDAFANVSENTDKLRHIVSEILVASREQSTGIDQVNASISEVEQAILDNVEHSRDSADASHRINTQVEELEDSVKSLSLLITGKKKKNEA